MPSVIGPAQKEEGGEESGMRNNCKSQVIDTTDMGHRTLCRYLGLI